VERQNGRRKTGRKPARRMLRQDVPGPPPTGSPVSTTTWRRPSRRATRIRAASSAPWAPRPRWAGSVAARLAHPPPAAAKSEPVATSRPPSYAPRQCHPRRVASGANPAAEIVGQAEGRRDELAHAVRVARRDRPHGEAGGLGLRHGRPRIAGELHPGEVALVAARRDGALRRAALRHADAGGNPLFHEEPLDGRRIGDRPERVVEHPQPGQAGGRHAVGAAGPRVDEPVARGERPRRGGPHVAVAGELGGLEQPVEGERHHEDRRRPAHRHSRATLRG
jgi:hypothetical protein